MALTKSIAQWVRQLSWPILLEEFEEDPNVDFTWCDRTVKQMSSVSWRGTGKSCIAEEFRQKPDI